MRSKAVDVYKRQRFDRARDYLNAALLYGGGLLLLLSALVVGFAGPLSQGFVSSAPAAAIVQHSFYIVGIGYVLNLSLIQICFEHRLQEIRLRNARSLNNEFDKYGNPLSCSVKTRR